jgi:hypothetical protein
VPEKDKKNALVDVLKTVHNISKLGIPISRFRGELSPQVQYKATIKLHDIF